MFESSNGNFDLQKSHINDKGDYVITAGLTNNGILGKTDIDAKIFDEKTVTIDMFGAVFFRQFKYKMVTHARVFSLKPKFEITEKQGLFLANSLHSLNKRFGYENMCSWGKIQNDNIQLPTKNGEIDFVFMESFIAELEASRIAELEAYLVATGLTNYTLTKKEEKVLMDFENDQNTRGGGEINWQEFRLGDLFEIDGTKSLDSNAIDFVNNGINFIGRTFENNGIQGQIQARDFEPNEAFTITATVIGNYKYVKYQKESYYCSQNINKLTPKNVIQKWNQKVAYYFVTNIQKFVSLYDYQQGGYRLEDIKNHIIYLPTENHLPNYELMETFISAVQKLIIKGVVIYADKKITASKMLIR